VATSAFVGTNPEKLAANFYIARHPPGIASAPLNVV